MPREGEEGRSRGGDAGKAARHRRKARSGCSRGRGRKAARRRRRESLHLRAPAPSPDAADTILGPLARHQTPPSSLPQFAPRPSWPPRPWRRPLCASFLDRAIPCPARDAPRTTASDSRVASPHTEPTRARKESPDGFVTKPGTLTDGIVKLMIWHHTIPSMQGENRIGTGMEMEEDDRAARVLLSSQCLGYSGTASPSLSVCVRR